MGAALRLGRLVLGSGRCTDRLSPAIRPSVVRMGAAQVPSVLHRRTWFTLSVAGPAVAGPAYFTEGHGLLCLWDPGLAASRRLGHCFRRWQGIAWNMGAAWFQGAMDGRGFCTAVGATARAGGLPSACNWHQAWV